MQRTTRARGTCNQGRCNCASRDAFYGCVGRALALAGLRADVSYILMCMIIGHNDLSGQIHR